jgi:hypothetical protein
LRVSTSKCCNIAAAILLVAVGTASVATGAEQQGSIELQLRPRVCTLADDAAVCDTVVRAQWRSARNESLCLVIVDYDHIKHCWENHSHGEYSVEVAFSRDLVVQLRDADLDRVLASQAIAVIRKALQLRRKRRQPWSIFY